MVVQAFRGAAPMVATPAGVVEPNGVVAQVHSVAAVPEYSLVGAAEFFEDVASVAPPSEPEVQHATPFGSRDELSFGFFENEDPDYTIHPAEADAPDALANGFSLHCDEASDEFEGPIGITETKPGLEYAQSDDAQPVEEPLAFNESAVDSVSTGLNPVEDLIVEQPSIPEAVATDPSEAALPAWDYSQSEWPVLVGTSKRRSFASPRAAIATVVVVACVAGFYFLVYLPSNPERRATDSGITARVSAVAEARVSTPEAADSAIGQRPPSTPSESPGGASQTAERVAPEAAASEDINAQGRFSLQAAAFPTQGGADEFAEKLKRAGVGSYVVPADLARRGRWFRVRVGRFNTADDAQRFAGETQHRARTAGLALQLIVCQYDQP